MKTVKLNFSGVYENYNKEYNLVCDVLRAKGYQVEISDEPDYLICDCFGDDPYQYVGKPQVRIMYSGENYIPDFNLIDYGISVYPIQFGDRHFQLPTSVCINSRWRELCRKSREYTMQTVTDKPYFANFIAGHESEYGIRGDFFKALCQYRRVESAGSYLNNMDGFTVSWNNDSKTDFQRKCKFTLCFESTLHYGFVTEKLMDAFYSDTIPVYYGSPTAAEVFNRKAFINVAEYPSFEAAIARIMELDQDDEKYLEMLRQPVFADPQYPERLEAELGAFLCNIVDQPLEKAYRRSRVFTPRRCEEYLIRAVDANLYTVKGRCKRMAKSLLRRFGKA